jgi:hypothetical protein
MRSKEASDDMDWYFKALIANSETAFIRPQITVPIPPPSPEVNMPNQEEAE